MRRWLAYAVLLALAVACTFDASRPLQRRRWLHRAQLDSERGHPGNPGRPRGSWTHRRSQRLAVQDGAALAGFAAVEWTRSHHVHGCRVTVVDADVPFAFCAGVARPRVFISRTLTERLAAGELRAVVLHEASHARRRDPLRRALRVAAAETLFFALREVVGRTRRGRRRVDRRPAALQDCPVGDLAGALLMTGSPSAALAPSFDGAAASRIAHLLGETAALPAPPAHVWRRSVAGFVPLLVVLGCLAASLVLSR